MDFNYRVKVLGESIDSLLAMGFAVNAHDCKPGEYWVIGCSKTFLQNKVQARKLKTISQYEAIRG